MVTLLYIMIIGSHLKAEIKIERLSDLSKVIYLGSGINTNLRLVISAIRTMAVYTWLPL